MKKTVAAFIALFVIGMGVMVGWGFIDKQSKENESKQNSSYPDSNFQKENTVSDASSPTSQAIYTAAELSKHKSPQDCWVAINGNIYNVTAYLDKHPGGSDLILMVCGQDATKAFNTQGGTGGQHSSSAKQELEKYKIGTLAD